MWIFGLIVLFLVILGVVFLCGKGAFLIAGYNTMSPEEKARWDEKALCKAVGVLMLVCAVFFAVVGLSAVFQNYILLTVSTISFLVVVFAGVVYVNTTKKFKR